MIAFLPWLMACRRPALPEPSLDAVVPEYAWNGQDNTITIVGDHFFPMVDVDARSGEATVNPSYQAWLVGPQGGLLRHELIGVGILDERHLSATVGKGLDPGSYDVVIEAPTGSTAALTGAFQITDAQAAQLLLSSAQAVYSVTEEAELTVELVDVGGDVVDVPLEVAVVAVPGTSGASVTFDAGTLDQAVPTPDGDGLRGIVLGGVAHLSVRPSIPDRLAISVVPWDAASNVVGDQMVLTFEPGDDLHVSFQLPKSMGEPAVATAGEPVEIVARVVDQYDNAVDDPIPVTLRTACSGWVEDVVLDGRTTLSVVPRLATSDFCSEDRVEVVQPISLAGSSATYTVQAGPTDHFRVSASPPLSQAGDQVDVLVDPEDAFGNRSTWTGEVSIQDSESGMIDDECQVFATTILCTGTVTRAAPVVTVRADALDGTSGVSNEIEVVADDVPGAIELTVGTRSVAGEDTEVLVRVADAWDNTIDAGTLGPGELQLTDELGDVSCTDAGTVGTSERFLCRFHVARPTATLEVTLASASLADQGTTRVVNGALAVVTFTHPASTTAGVPVQVSLEGRDAFGNPYVAQTDPVVILSDDSGTFDVSQATLGAAGATTITGTFTKAGTTHLVASQAGVELGRSAGISVAPGSTVGLRVVPADPWGWVTVPMEITVESVDDWDNRTDQTLSATLSSLATTSPSVPVNVVNGVGVATFAWTEAALPDTLDATSDTLDGEVELLVARVCGGVGPTARVSFAGNPEGIACTDPSGTAPLVTDLSGSTRGVAALAAYGVSVAGGTAVVGAQPALVATLPSIGRHDLYGLVIDNTGCGSEVVAEAWAGPDDGSATGPVPLSASAATIGVVDTVTLQVTGVVDCARDPASFAVLEVSTTVGELPGLLSSGAGLEAVLDINGDGSTSLSTTGGVAATTGEVVAWTDNGSASGRLDIPVVGDNVRPVVLGSDPGGFGTASISTLALRFSEALLPATVVPANFTLAGPSAVSVSAATVQGTDVILDLAQPLDQSLGVYTINASSNLRDLAGNRLAGTWGTQPAAWIGGVGGAGTLPPGASCEAFVPSTLLFRPDGDDGAGEEADTFQITVRSSSAPAWWVMEVVDGQVLVDARWFVPLGATDTLSWDGRDMLGAVVPDGTYAVSIAPDDGLGNTGAPCVSTVIVDNLPPGIP
ncbi:MAG: Ig-like domain-containing protein [Myxococcales bacterium]|nr:Ig-like domain-containing protein [Myxococcales bacterium]